MQYRRISARGVVLKDGKMLCVKQKSYEGSISKTNGYWCTPGGGLEAGESLEECCAREMLEETGIPAKVGNLLYIQQFEHEGTEYLEFFFHVTNAADYEAVDLAQSTHGEKEIADIAFIDPKSNIVLPKLFTREPLEADAVKGVTRFFFYS
jgi:ADP-ribose pyrophosphatase YjhB (NUDIX family)